MNTYEKHVLANPALPFIFHVDHLCHKTTPQRGNWHENIEILCFIEGEGNVRLNARNFSVSPGDIVVVNSNCLHEFSTDSKMKYHCLIIDRSFCVANYIDTNKIHFKSQFKDEKLTHYFNDLRHNFEMAESVAWRTQTIRALVLSLLTEVCKKYSEAYDETLDSDIRLISCIKKAIGYIRSEYQREITLDEMCDLVGLSKYYFAREFKRITGHTIVNYINLTRCENAKVLLCESDVSIAQIAAQCGFADQSYFTRVFRATTGMSPTRYRKENMNVK